MKPIASTKFTALIAGAGLSLAMLSTSAHAFDEKAAVSLAKKNDCTKCHSVDKDKKGPSYQKIAAELKKKPNPEEVVRKSITTGPKVKLSDGTEEEHKIINTKDEAAIKNLIAWILAQ